MKKIIKTKSAEKNSTVVEVSAEALQQVSGGQMAVHPIPRRFVAAR
jgi:hypothetical protein